MFSFMRMCCIFDDEVLRLAESARWGECVAGDADRAGWGETAAGDADRAGWGETAAGDADLTMQYFSGTY